MQCHAERATPGNALDVMPRIVLQILPPHIAPSYRTPQRPPLSAQKTSKRCQGAAMALLWRCNHVGQCVAVWALLNSIIELLCFSLIYKGFTLPTTYLAG
jgi:hypothetical protein